MEERKILLQGWHTGHQQSGFLLVGQAANYMYPTGTFPAVHQPQEKRKFRGGMAPFDPLQVKGGPFNTPPPIHTHAWASYFGMKKEGDRGPFHCPQRSSDSAKVKMMPKGIRDLTLSINVKVNYQFALLIIHDSQSTARHYGRGVACGFIFLERYRNPLTVYYRYSNSTDPDEGLVSNNFARVSTVRELWLLAAASLVRHQRTHGRKGFHALRTYHYSQTPQLRAIP